jgi:hypothetical protein
VIYFGGEIRNKVGTCTFNDILGYERSSIFQIWAATTKQTGLRNKINKQFVANVTGGTYCGFPKQSPPDIEETAFKISTSHTFAT